MNKKSKDQWTISLDDFAYDSPGMKDLIKKVGEDVREMHKSDKNKPKFIFKKHEGIIADKKKNEGEG